MFSLASVEKAFGELVAIADMDLDVLPGRTLALIGGSGCGKSTLLRLMLGLEEPDAGEIYFAGERIDTSDTSAIESVRRQVGYVIQEGGLFPHLESARNIDILARHLNWPEPDRNARIEELCALTHFPISGLDRRPGQLSGGQRQRVALMRALMLNPDVILLDEPLGALDPLIRFDLQQELGEIFRRLEKTVVLVTHDLNEADFLADELVLLRDGRIEQRGSLEALRTHPASDFVERFLRAQHGLTGQVREEPA
ncbi:MAG: ATP-binding cassette domain-containing protein [bacterium]|nr:ATP-binding cassette domain-containing protein [bacterium]